MIAFNKVSKSYSQEILVKESKALQQLSFELEAGKILGLIGVNGAGKSTCIRLLMDFIRPDCGTIQIFNTPPSDFLTRKKIGYLPEAAHQLPLNLNILSLIRFTAVTCKLSTTDCKINSERWLKELGLWEVRKRPLKTYSKGMRQRANFVLALVNDPELLILDEPMSGLDPIGRDTIIKLILQLKSEGKTILFCSHILDDVDKIVDDILLLNEGEKLFYGTPRELANQEGKSSMEEAFVSILKTKGQHD